jgi:hypothetical protein
LYEIGRVCNRNKGGEKENKKNEDRVLVGKRPLGRPRRRWEDNIRMDLRNIGWSDVDWIHLAQVRDQWMALVNTVINLRVP